MIDGPTEVVPAGWVGGRQARDQLLVGGDALTVTLDDRTTRLPASRLHRADVWRGPDGVRRYRVLDAEERTVAVLDDGHWRLPQGRLAPLLEGLGCPVRSIDAPAGPDALPDQRVSGARGLPLRGGWVVGAALLMVLVGLAAAVIAGRGSDAPEWGPATIAVAGWGCAGYLLLLAAWWLPGRRRQPRVSGLAPGRGNRSGWRAGARVGLVGGRVVATDGWGRRALWPARGPEAPAAVATGDDAAVLVGAAGGALARFPLAAWAHPDEDADVLAARVAQACGLPRTDRPAPAGGEEVVDPEPPGLALTLLAALGIAFPFAFILLLGVSPVVAGNPRAVAWVPALAGLLAVAGHAGGLVVSRARLGRGRPRDQRPGQVLLICYPLLAGGFLCLIILWGFLLPDTALRVWTAAFGPLGMVGIALTLRAWGANPLWTVAALSEPLFAGVLTFGMRGGLWPWAVWTNVAVGAVAAALFVANLVWRRAVRHPLR